MAIVKGDRIGESQRLNRCTTEAQDFYAAMLGAEVADDFGRFRESAQHVAIRMYPRREPTAAAIRRIKRLMAQLREAGLWRTWEVDGVEFAELYNATPRGNLYHRTPEPPVTIGVQPHIHTRRCATTAVARAKEWGDVNAVESLSLLIKKKAQTGSEQEPRRPRASVPSVPSVPSSNGDVKQESDGVDRVAAWRAADGRTMPQLAEMVVAYAPQFPHLTPLEACRLWCEQNGVPLELVPSIMQALDRMPKGREVPDDFGPPGECERLQAEGLPLVESIARDEGLDPSEVVSTASEYRGHKHTRLDRIPTNRYTRLVHTVNHLRAWRRRLDGKPGTGVASKDPPRKTVGEQNMAGMERFVKRRRVDVAVADGRGGADSGKALQAGDVLPPAAGRSNR